MRIAKTILAAAAAALLLTACRGGGKKGQADPANNKFAMPEVPALITDNQEAIDYITAHYWDKFLAEDRPGVQDTSLVRGFTQQAFEDAFYQFSMFLRGSTTAKGLDACRNFLGKVEKISLEDPESTLWSKVKGTYYHILQDPNSPWRNEEYCIPLLEKLASSPLASDTEKERAAKELPRFCLNRLGEKAADFAFTLRNGRTMQMYDISSEYTVLFFSNPGCPNCREVMETLQQFPGIDDLIAHNLLAVANVYPDEDLGEWIKYSEIYPKNWLNGYDHLLAINNVPLYNLRAIPSVYLLDKDKKVLLKDAPTDFFVQYLNNIFGQGAY
ncbi:MAG: DUF5106 domain-containing protein [Bacteroidales bacterium]|nr:DUF5106 domain-containing protein [Bacteroidales bacterium]